MQIKSIADIVLFVSAALNIKGALVEAVSKKTDLSGANLSGADLSEANLSWAYLRWAYLRWANLSGANLSGANLSGANLSGANLCGANLRGAYLSGANLSGANLRGADFRGADLCGADFRGADLCGADLSGASGKKVKIAAARVFSGLYDYEVWAVLLEDGSRWVRMGCLFYSLEKWEKIGIRASNKSEFPDDGSERCEERVAAFEFAKAAALRLALRVEKQVGQ